MIKHIYIIHIFLLLAISIIITGCSKSEIDVKNDNDNEECDTICILPVRYYNVVELKLTMYDNIIDSEVELAREAWKFGDVFSFTLPDTLASNYLHLFINNIGVQTSIILTSSTLNISNKNVNVGNAILDKTEHTHPKNGEELA